MLRPVRKTVTGIVPGSVRPKTEFAVRLMPREAESNGRDLADRRIDRAAIFAESCYRL